MQPDLKPVRVWFSLDKLVAAVVVALLGLASWTYSEVRDIHNTKATKADVQSIKESIDFLVKCHVERTCVK